MYLLKEAVVCRYLCGVGKVATTPFSLTGLRVGQSVFCRQITQKFYCGNFDVKEMSYSLDTTMNSRI